MHRLLIVMTLAAGATAMGDEPNVFVHFRDKVQINSRVVLLSDVAEVDSNDAQLAQRLLQTELVAAPAAGQIRSMRQRELIDHIQLNGFNLQKIEFSGASLIQVSTGANAKGARSSAPTAGRLSAAQRRVKQVVTTYLRAAQPEARRSALDVLCDEACATAAAAAASTLSVVNSEPNGSGGYDVIVAITSKGVVEEFTVKATVAQANRVVVAARAIRPGAILVSADLKLAVPRSDAEQASAATDIEELIGREATRSVGIDQIVPLDQVVQPRLIRRGDLVEVTARSGGVRVTTQAVAQEDGALGQSISLEPVDAKAKVGQKNKEIIRAQVVASGQAQIDIASRPAPAARIGAEPARLRPPSARLLNR